MMQLLEPWGSLILLELNKGIDQNDCQKLTGKHVNKCGNMMLQQQQ
jgi:hypothetical protein